MIMPASNYPRMQLSYTHTHTHTHTYTHIHTYIYIHTYTQQSCSTRSLSTYIIVQLLQRPLTIVLYMP